MNFSWRLNLVMSVMNRLAIVKVYGLREVDIWYFCRSKSIGGSELLTEQRKVDSGSQRMNGCWSLGQRRKKVEKLRQRVTDR